MTRGSLLAKIPVRIEPARAPHLAAADGATIGGGVAAILTEIATLLEQVATGGEPAAIDLRSLPMSPADREGLAQALGRGEVEIILNAHGESRIRETGVQGVWWTEHCNPDGETIATYIEIARVPGILLVPDVELRRGAARLRETAHTAAASRAESLHATT